MTALVLTVASLLALVLLVHGDCVIDPSMPCECTNPFLGTDNFFLGDATKNCNSAKACYVKNLSGCADARQSRGGNRCQSKLACKSKQPDTTVKPTSEPKPSEPTTSEPKPEEPTPSEPTPSEPKPTEQPTSSKPNVVDPTPTDS